jgi:hypothetical protein
LVSREDVLRSVEEAKKEREKAIKEEKKSKGEEEESEEEEEEGEERKDEEDEEKESERTREKKEEKEYITQEEKKQKEEKNGSLENRKINGEKQENNSSKQALDKVEFLKKETEPQFYFTLKNDKKLKSIYDLIEELEIMSDDVFYYHVNDFKNDFENWIRFVFLNNELADKISKTKTKRDMLKAIGEYLGRSS